MLNSGYFITILLKNSGKLATAPPPPSEKHQLHRPMPLRLQLGVFYYKNTIMIVFFNNGQKILLDNVNDSALVQSQAGQVLIKEYLKLIFLVPITTSSLIRLLLLSFILMEASCAERRVTWQHHARSRLLWKLNSEGFINIIHI
jgi:hypothetical protein